MHTQKNVTLKVDGGLVEKAHRYGINISRFLEYALDNAFRNDFENLTQNQKKSEWTGRDLIKVLREYRTMLTKLRSNRIQLKRKPDILCYIIVWYSDSGCLQQFK